MERGKVALKVARTLRVCSTDALAGVRRSECAQRHLSDVLYFIAMTL